MMRANPLLMPKLGLTMTEGLLASWQVAVGDAVKAGDVLFVVETDKIATEVEARSAGTIVSLDIAEGETVPVGAALGQWTGVSSTSEEDTKPPPDPVHRETMPEPATPNSGVGDSDPSTSRVKATPLARRLAASRGINIRHLQGSGPGGRIKAIDVEQARAGWPVIEPVPPPATRDAPLRRPATRMETIIARRLTEAKQTIPHFYAFADLDITEVLRLRQDLNADAGTMMPVSVTHLLLAALARALALDPKLNARWDDSAIVQFATIDVGLAVATDAGLMVPVLRGVDRLGLDALASSATSLVDRARSGKLGADELEGGAISISNVGMFGADALAPIINPGQSAILGVGRPKPVFRPDEGGRPELRQELRLVLSCDHRIYDGVAAAKLLDRLRGFVEHPLRLLRT